MCQNLFLSMKRSAGGRIGSGFVGNKKDKTEGVTPPVQCFLPKAKTAPTATTAMEMARA